MAALPRARRLQARPLRSGCIRTPAEISLPFLHLVTPAPEREEGWREREEGGRRRRGCNGAPGAAQRNDGGRANGTNDSVPIAHRLGGGDLDGEAAGLRRRRRRSEGISETATSGNLKLDEVLYFS
ncbi:hypothetical protein SETIT_7G244500v2 [Setaria italica]|uniref:DUF834 domain-containing protein n=1 Tax=Setaria italica TaxID=4555 RepID=A0A368RZC4_SETIT|nr:hypothetical protein SETIT_7G244500v2 [Setaria italica]